MEQSENLVVSGFIGQRLKHQDSAPVFDLVGSGFPLLPGFAGMALRRQAGGNLVTGIFPGDVQCYKLLSGIRYPK